MALSGLKIYKLQSDYADKIHELNLSAETTLVTALFNASFKKWIYFRTTAGGQFRKMAGMVEPERIICNAFKLFPSTAKINS